MARPTKDLSRDTRRAILDAALDLFAEHGFFGTSTRQIARAVGVRESALYHYFKSKLAILEALIDELGPGKAERLRELDVVGLARAMGASALFRQIAQTVIAEWSTERERKFFRLLMSEGPRLGSAGVIHPTTYMARARASLGQVFSKLSKAKLIGKVDPQAATLAFMGPLMALRIHYLGVLHDKVDLRQLQKEVDAHLAFFQRAIT